MPLLFRGDDDKDDDDDDDETVAQQLCHQTPVILKGGKLCSWTVQEEQKHVPTPAGVFFQAGLKTKAGNHMSTADRLFNESGQGGLRQQKTAH